MSEKHTPGRMTWKRRPDGSLYYVIGDHKTGPHAQGDIYIEEADLRRLVACWNACDGIDTGYLEGDDSLPHYARRLMAQRDELLDLLNRAVRRLEIAHANGDTIMREWIVDARAAIAKATGQEGGAA